MLLRLPFRCLFLALLLLVLPARAADLVVVVSDRSTAFSEFADQLRHSLQGSTWLIRAVLTPDTLAEAPRDSDLWVVAGSEAMRQVMAQPQTPPLLATLLSRQSFERLLTSATRSRSGVGAIVLDQPPARQLALVHQLFPERKRLGLLNSAESRTFVSRVKAAAGSLHIENEEAYDDSAVVPAANRVLARSDVLLAQADALIYSRANIRPILLASYRLGRPVVGFSASFVNAGAIAALYSTPSQIAIQTGDILTSGRKLPQGIVAPERFSLAVNRQVAQSLGIDLPDENTVLRALENRRFEP